MTGIVPGEEAVEWYTREPGHLSKGEPSGWMELKKYIVQNEETWCGGATAERRCCGMSRNDRVIDVTLRPGEKAN